MPLILPHPITPTLTGVYSLMVAPFVEGFRFQASGFSFLLPVAFTSPARPEHAASDYLLCLWHFEVSGDVAQGAVEHASFAPPTLPDDGHYVARDPGHVLSGEGGGREDLVGRVDVHVVLLGVHLKVFETGGYGVFVVYDVDFVVDNVAGMGHPLAPDHELVVYALAERVGHAAVPAGESDPALYGPAQSLLLLVCYGSHGPDRDYEVEGSHLLFVEVGIEGGRDLHLVVVLLQQRREDGGALLGLVALPAAADEER